MNVSTETLVAQPALVEPVRRWWSLTLPQLWAFVAVAFTALFLEGKLLSVDLAYQVRAGQIMLGSHSLTIRAMTGFVEMPNA